MPLNVRPRDVYDVYPGADLVALPAPEQTDTFTSYIDAADHRNITYCGDTLYAFILFELSDASSDEEALRRIRQAIADLQAIETKIQEIINVRS